MKKFLQYQIREAIKYSEKGGQALHLHKIIVNKKTAPKCFVRDVNAGKCIAHLFDMDLKRLIKTAKSVGVRVIKIDREGTDSQHIDFCGKPLERLLEKIDE